MIWFRFISVVVVVILLLILLGVMVTGGDNE